MSPTAATQVLTNPCGSVGSEVQPLPALFVTGTDTGVGKTLISAALLHALAAH